MEIYKLFDGKKEKMLDVVRPWMDSWKERTKHRQSENVLRRWYRWYLLNKPIFPKQLTFCDDDFLGLELFNRTLR